MSLIIKAAQFAAKAHAGQARKYNGTPYILHPMRVAGRVTLLPDTNERHIAAAWLHDVVEDCGVTPEQLTAEFDPLVASLVMQLTNPSIGSPLRRAERKVMDREHVGAASTTAKRIKLLDRIDNCNEMTSEDGKFIELYARESHDLLQAIGDADEALSEELRQSIDSLLSRSPTRLTLCQ